MLRRLPLLAALALLAALIWPPAFAGAEPSPVPQPATTPTGFTFFSETGHNIGAKIKRFYDAHGGLDIFGLPLTEVISDENGLEVQYFERARFELHPDLPSDFYVSISRLGADAAAGRADQPFQWLASSDSADRDFYPQSGHTLGGAFREYWKIHGDLSVFGYPISEEFNEVNSQDGQTYLVQYFERARFEYHPEQVGTPYEVQLGQLGRQRLSMRADAQQVSAPVQPLVLLGSATTGFATSIAERRMNIAVATAMFDGLVIPSGQEHSFLSAGDFSEASGFVDGYAIVGGKLEKVVGGGLCQVSTTLFRAASNAGMEITRRTGHTYLVNFYENILGFDATVFTPNLDFRWRNDSPGSVYIVATSNPAAATVTFELWGESDGRKVAYSGPVVSNVVKPGGPTWQFDKSLPAGATRQMVHGRSGMDVVLTRNVTLPDGTVKHHDVWYTHYRPWNDFFTYGVGVTPPSGVTVIDPRSDYTDTTPARSSSQSSDASRP